MSQIKQKLYTPIDPLTSVEIERTATFLHQQLGQYSDPKEDIIGSLQYAMGLNGKPGGLIILCKSSNNIIAAV
jgi:hypothetical protein